MGVQVAQDGLRVTVNPGEPSAMDVRVPGDVSGAAFWLVAGCCHPDAQLRVEGVGINPSRTGVLEVLESMGATIRIENIREDAGEPVADIVVESSLLEATEIAGKMIPRVIDELPVLALAACFARGTTVIRDAQELRVKESDRIRATVQGLRSLGAHISSSFQGTPTTDDAEQRDGMVIEGTRHLRGGACQSFGDHRIAMTMGAAGLLATGETLIDGAEAASVSYPSFWPHLRTLSKGARRATA
jgi:3-phosphoshikimate 1-carboxyvinyltransferase